MGAGMEGGGMNGDFGERLLAKNIEPGSENVVIFLMSDHKIQATDLISPDRHNEFQRRVDFI